MRVKLLQRELFKEMTLSGTICLAGLLSLILLGRLLQMRELFLSQGVTIIDMFKLFVFLSPFFLLLLVPVSCMMGLFLTLLRMGADRELISLRAGGVSFWKLLPAPLALCLVCTCLTMWVSLVGISWGMDHFRETVLQLAKHKTVINVVPGVFNTAFPNLTVYARQADPESGELLDVFVMDRSRKNQTATITAPQGRIDSNSEAGQIYVQLKDGHIYHEQRDDTSVVSFGHYMLALDMSQLLGGFSIGGKSPKEMSWDELLHISDDPRQAKDENLYRRVLIEVQKRYALPLACVVLGIFAIPLALFFQGLRRQTGLVVALGTFFVYYILLSAGMALAEAGSISPVFALWAPNILFLGLGCYGLWLVAQERELPRPKLLRLLLPRAGQVNA